MMKKAVTFVTLACLLLGCARSTPEPIRDAAVGPTDARPSSSASRSAPRVRAGRALAGRAAGQTLPPDTRTPDQLANDACTKADGTWNPHCSNRKAPKVARASLPSQPTINPPSWSIGNWYVDGQNVTGCASDGNSCTSRTCSAGGIGPCLSQEEIIQGRWGTREPQLEVAVTINVLSDAYSNYPGIVDIGNVDPNIGASELTIQGAGQGGWLSGGLTTTFSNVPSTIGTYTPLNRSGNTLGTISVSFGSGFTWSNACTPNLYSGGYGGSTTSCVGMMVHDTTNLCSFPIAADLGSGVAAIGGPVVYPVQYAASPCTPANGDTIIVGRGPYILPTDLRSHGVQVVMNTVSMGQWASVQVQGYYILQEVGLGNTGYYAGTLLFGACTSCSLLPGGSLEGAWNLSDGAYMGNVLMTNSQIENDVAFLGLFVAAGPNLISSAYLASGPVREIGAFGFLPAVYMVDENGEPYGIYGPVSGGFNLVNGDQLILPPSNTAATALLFTTPIKLDGLTTGCAFSPTTGLTTCGITTSKANFDSPPCTGCVPGLSSPQNTGSGVIY